MTAARYTKRWKSWTVDDPLPEVLRFIDWYCHKRRYGESVDEYAEREGVPTYRVHMMRRDRRVMQLLDEALRFSNAGPIKVQQVLDMLHRRATCGDDVQAARTYLMAVDRLVPKMKLDVVHHDARNLSSDELAAELKRAIALLESQKGLPEPVIEAEVIEDSEDMIAVAGY